ncbi:MAG: HEAT repeat domain-containing protein, partial [Planctomycetota bacterium]
WARIGRLAGRLRGEWAAVAFVVLLALVFLGIAFRPVLRAKVHRYRLTAEAEADRDAAQAALAAAGGGAVTREMIDLVLTGTDNDARYRAVRVLGAIGATEALPVLEGVRDDPKEAPLVRAAAREAIVGIEAY